MNESEMREPLLRQNGGPSVEAELKMLRKLMDAETRRIGRLKHWTIGIWAVWLAVVVVTFGAYGFLAGPAPKALPAVQREAPAGQAPPKESSPLLSAITMIVVFLLFACVAGLPIVGIIFLVILMLSPRSATVTQLRSSLAALDAQLRLLAATQRKPADGPGN
jgi:hypothetical protein